MSETMTKYFVTAGIARSKAILFLEGDQKRPNFSTKVVQKPAQLDFQAPIAFLSRYMYTARQMSQQNPMKLGSASAYFEPR